jgi:hypothetical protein
MPFGRVTNGFISLRRLMDATKFALFADSNNDGFIVQEFAFRLNDGNVKRHTMDRLDSFITATSGMRLTYERLTA